MIDYYEVPVQDYVWESCVLTVDAPADPLIDNVLRNITARSNFTLTRTTGPADITIYTDVHLQSYAGYATVYWDRNRVAYRATVELDESPYRRGLVMHELLHVLGFDHARNGIMYPTLHRNTLTKWDRVALRGLTCG